MRKRRWFYLWQFKTNVINIGYWLINPIFRWNLNSEWSRCVIGVTRMQRFILWAKLEVMNKQTGLDETGVPEVPEVLATAWTGSPEWPLSVLKIQCSSMSQNWQQIRFFVTPAKFCIIWKYIFPDICVPWQKRSKGHCFFSNNLLILAHRELLCPITLVPCYSLKGINRWFEYTPGIQHFSNLK